MRRKLLSPNDLIKKLLKGLISEEQKEDKHLKVVKRSKKRSIKNAK